VLGVPLYPGAQFIRSYNAGRGQRGVLPRASQNDRRRILSALALNSRAHLAAENLFLRKQLALYLERQVKPRRADDATRITLVALVPVGAVARSTDNRHARHADPMASKRISPVLAMAIAGARTSGQSKQTCVS
jgi:hypothetical protein